MSASTPLFRMAVRNVRRNWRHSLGTVLAIAVGFLAIGLFEGYLGELAGSLGWTFSRRAMFGDLLVERTGRSSSEGREDPWAYQLGEPEQAFLDGYLAAHAAEVMTRARSLAVTGLASTGKAGAVVLAQGFDVVEGAKLRGELRWNAVAGRPLEDAPVASVMLATGLGRILDCEATGDQPTTGPDGRLIAEVRPFKCRRPRAQLTATTEKGQLNVVELEVAGLMSSGLEEFDTRLAFLPLEAAQRLLDTHAISRMTIALAPGVDPSDFGARLTRAAGERGLAITAQRWEKHEEAELYRRGLDLLGVYRSFVVLVVVTVAAMSVLMTVMKSVSERTREIGTLRSLGFLRRHIVWLFVVEAGLLAGLASAVGAAATGLATLAVNYSGVTYKAGVMSDAIPLAVRVVPQAYLFAVGFLSLVAMGAAVLPARRAARLGIPDALGHV